MPTAIKPEAIAQARNPRRGMTAGERRPWSDLKDFRRLYGAHVRKQAPIGSCIVDFVIHERRLVIEVDGEHHELPERMRRGARRDAWPAGEGYRVVRLRTGESADNSDGCVEEVLRAAGLFR